MKCLIVDDELVSRMKMQKIMTGIGDCQAVDNGQAAIAAFEAAWQRWAPIDLILLDISMPDLSGAEVLRRIRKKEKNVPEIKRVKIVMVSASKDKESIIECIQSGCDDYIMKPFDKLTVIKKIDALNLPCTDRNSAEKYPQNSDEPVKKARDETPDEHSQDDNSEAAGAEKQIVNLDIDDI